MPHCTAHSASGTRPNQPVFAENRWRGGLNVKEPPVAVPIARRAENFGFLRYAIETFTECFFIFQEKKV